MFWQPARKYTQSYHDYASFCPAKHDVYSVLSTEGSLNVNISHIIYIRTRGRTSLDTRPSVQPCSMLTKQHRIACIYQHTRGVFHIQRAYKVHLSKWHTCLLVVPLRLVDKTASHSVYLSTHTRCISHSTHVQRLSLKMVHVSPCGPVAFVHASSPVHLLFLIILWLVSYNCHTVCAKQKQYS